MQNLVDNRKSGLQAIKSSSLPLAPGQIEISNAVAFMLAFDEKDVDSASFPLPMCFATAKMDTNSNYSHSIEYTRLSH